VLVRGNEAAARISLERHDGAAVELEKFNGVPNPEDQKLLRPYLLIEALTMRVRFEYFATRPSFFAGGHEEYTKEPRFWYKVSSSKSLFTSKTAYSPLLLSKQPNPENRLQEKLATEEWDCIILQEQGDLGSVSLVILESMDGITERIGMVHLTLQVSDRRGDTGQYREDQPKSRRMIRLS
jgi:hypothetical protein